MDKNDAVMLGVVGVTQGERIKSTMLSKGIVVEAFPQTLDCSSCAMKLEVWAHKDDVQKIQEIMQQDQLKNYQGLSVDVDQINHVFDPSKEDATCPACGTHFKTSHSECPDCGLVLG